MLPNSLAVHLAALLVLIWLTVTTAAPAYCADQSQAVALLVRTLGETDNDAVRGALLRGMLQGLAGRRNLPTPPGWTDLKTKLGQSVDPQVRDMTDQLARMFGDPEAIERAMATLRDKQAATSARRSALKSLLAQQHRAVLTELEPLLDDPELQVDAIRAYSVMESPKAASMLVSRYKSLNPQARKAVIETLSTRKNYATALVRAIESKLIPRDDIPAYVARSMREIAADEFTRVYGDVPELEANTSGLLSRYKKIITDEAIATADVGKGRAVFQKTCAACHLLYGEGGKIGPDLTGSNRANLDYILLNSLAPSYDVPEGYRMVIIQTVDGRVLNGVIGGEDAQRIVLKTVDQGEVVIPKDDIEVRKVSEKSMMPDGQLQQLKQQEVIDLIKYLRTTEQVELAQ